MNMVKRTRLGRTRLVLATTVFKEVDKLLNAGHDWEEVVGHIAHKYFGGDEARADVWLRHRV